MESISNLQSNSVMIFPIDSIHLPIFRRPDAIKILNESFKLQVLTQAEAFLVNPNQIVFRNGLF
jgi:hypothetical protein